MLLSVMHIYQEGIWIRLANSFLQGEYAESWQSAEPSAHITTRASGLWSSDIDLCRFFRPIIPSLFKVATSMPRGGGDD